MNLKNGGCDLKLRNEYNFLIIFLNRLWCDFVIINRHHMIYFEIYSYVNELYDLFWRLQ